MLIDTHHHYWNYNPVDFDWIDDEMTAIRRDFLPVDLKAILSANGVDGVVSVQARQCLEETDWLLEMAAENEFMRGVVGWVPLIAENIQDILEKYTVNPWLKAVRHVIQAEPDPEFIFRRNFNRGVALLKNFGLVYDILIFEHQLVNSMRFVDQHPEQQFVLDHLAKPQIKAGKLEPWARNLKELARRENVFCKVSGMLTEADYKSWTSEQLRPYLDTVLEAFGPSRLLYGSDWPVCLVAGSYGNWLQLVRNVFSELTTDEQDLIFYKNAEKIYQL